MKCTKDGCSGKLRITNTWDNGASKHQRAVCPACKRVHALQTIVEAVAKRGDGARARASLARKGEGLGGGKT